MPARNMKRGIVRLKKHDLVEIHENLKAAWASEELEFDDPLPEHLT